MPPPHGTPNPLEGPGDYTTTKTVHSDTYPAIHSSKANLYGKAVFITGASKGLGRAISIAFAKAGASHIAIGARSSLDTAEKDIKTAAASAGKAEPKVLSIRLDVANQKSTEDAASQIEKTFGKLDIVVNNAGVMHQIAPIADSDPEKWWETMNVNLNGPYLISRASLPLLLKGGDKTIVTVSSVGAHLTMPGLSAYQISKLAVLRLSEFICSEYHEQGVLSFCIHPGNVLTDIVNIGGESLAPEFQAVFTETPELSADSIVYLTSEKRDWLAGRYINSTWDLPELMRKKDEIVDGGKLKVKMVL